MFPSKELMNYGIAVATLAPVLGFILWAGRAVVVSLLKNIDEFFKSVQEQQKEITGAIKELGKAFTGIQYNCQVCRLDSVGTLRAAEESITRKFVDVTAALHDKTFTELEARFLMLGSKFETALNGAATSIRKGNEDLLLAAENQRLRADVAELSRPVNVGDGTVTRSVGG